MPEALNAVIYARYSSDRQTEQSIEGQLRECYAFAKANDIAVIDTYIDRAISGKTDNRPAFQKMIEDSAKRQFQAVIVYRLDRFTRNRYDSAIYKARLKKNGVKVLSAMENLNGSPESIIMESLLEGMAEYYSVELSQKITRGMRENALKGKALGGQRVLGYKVNSDCYFEIDETTAPVVVDIFKLYSSGKTVKEICDILNARGVKTARGGAFNKNSLHTILTNKKYIGIYKTKYGEIVGGIPAIIDKELFEMVALRMEQNKKAPARAKAEINYLLSTKLFCGKCRSAMVGESGTSKTGKKYYYYACVKKKREKACDKSNVKKDWIEDLVIQRTVTDILKDDVIDKIADRLVELQKAEAAESGTMLYLENSLAEIQVSIKNIMTAIEKGIITESTKTRLTELEDEKRNVEIEIAKESIARRIISREQIIYWISSFKDGNITSEKYRQQLIDTFVHAVFVYDDKIVITYNYSGENNTATISDLDLSSPPNSQNPNPFLGSDFSLYLIYIPLGPFSLSIGNHLGNPVIIHIDILVSPVTVYDLEFNPPHSGSLVPGNNDLRIIHTAFLHRLGDGLRRIGDGRLCRVPEINHHRRLFLPIRFPREFPVKIHILTGDFLGNGSPVGIQNRNCHGMGHRHESVFCIKLFIFNH